METCVTGRSGGVRPLRASLGWKGCFPKISVEMTVSQKQNRDQGYCSGHTAFLAGSALSGNTSNDSSGPGRGSAPWWVWWKLRAELCVVDKKKTSTKRSHSSPSIRSRDGSSLSQDHWLLTSSPDSGLEARTAQGCGKKNRHYPDPSSVQWAIGLPCVPDCVGDDTYCLSRSLTVQWGRI